MLDDRQLTARELDPVALIPLEPGVLLLVKGVERFVTELGEFSAPAGPAFDRLVFENLADDIISWPLLI